MDKKDYWRLEDKSNRVKWSKNQDDANISLSSLLDKQA